MNSCVQIDLFCYMIIQNLFNFIMSPIGNICLSQLNVAGDIG